MAPVTPLLRSDVDPDQTWNAPLVFASPQAWEDEYRHIDQSLPEVEKYRGHIADGPEVFSEAMNAIEQMMSRANAVLVYAHMTASVDASDQPASAMRSKAGGLIARAQAAASFVKPELLLMDASILDTWLTENPALTFYRQYIDNVLRMREHTRSAEVEDLLEKLADPFDSIMVTARVATSADLIFRPATSASGESIPVTQGNFDTELMFHSDREVRRTAYESYSDGHLSIKNTLAANLAVAVKQHVFSVRARGYQSALEASWAVHNIPTGIFQQLAEAFRRHLPTWHRYWDIKRKALGYDALTPYDIWAPLTTKPPVVPYAQAVDWISEGMKPLGEEYVQTLRRGCLTDRWVDRAPNAGKMPGAFSIPWRIPFIMMSYTDDVPSMSMLAHELGHSLHSWLIWQTQPFVYRPYSIFIAEVASNFNQALVRAYLLKNNPDPAFQIAVIEEAMFNFHRYFFIMPLLAQFELEIHQRVERGEGLTANSMNTLLADLFAEGYGNGLSFDRDYVGSRWMQFPLHLYFNFYVFQYTTGIAGAHALADRVLSGIPNAVEDYLIFLKTGSSLYPLDALKRAGVDLSTPDPIEKTFEVLASMIDRLEALTS